MGQNIDTVFVRSAEIELQVLFFIFSKRENMSNFVFKGQYQMIPFSVVIQWFSEEKPKLTSTFDLQN